MKSLFLSLLAATAILPQPTLGAAPSSASSVSDTVLVFSPGAGRVDVDLRFRNTGTDTWMREDSSETPVNLGTSNPENADSPFFIADAWLSGNRVKMHDAMVVPGEVAHFRFAVNIPAGDVKQEFRLVRENVGFFGPTVTIQTFGHSEKAGAAPAASVPTGNDGAKRVDVNLSTNRLKMIEGDTVLHDFIISPGKRATPTPTGNFKICSKNVDRYSKAFKLWMPHWNGFDCAGGYGIHGLPYWITKKGRVHEGASHLGLNVSHGCIRLSLANAKIFYDWTEMGTPVSIHY